MELVRARRAAMIALAFGLSSCAYSEPEITTGTIDLPPKVAINDKTATAEEIAACTASGGKIVRAGFRGWENCIRPMPDAGKTCKSSNECADKCLAVDTKTPFGQETTGKCAPTDNPFGCYATIENGVATPRLCVD